MNIMTISLENQSNQYIKQNSFCAKYGHVNDGLVQALNSLESKFYLGRLYRENVLSKKPTSVANNLVKFIQSQSRYSMSLKQDYSRNIIQMKLLASAYESNKGCQVLQIRELPVTNSIKSYTKTAKEMININDEIEQERFITNHIKSLDNAIMGLATKSSLFDRIKLILKKYFSL